MKTRVHRPRARTEKAPRDWTKRAADPCDALEIEPGLWQRSPRHIAVQLKRSAELSLHRHATPFRSAMSMLTYYENRAGRRLDPAQRHRIERAKRELRALFTGGTRSSPRSRPSRRLRST